MWQWFLPYLHHCKFSNTPDTSVMEQTHKASLCLCSCVSCDVRKWHTCCCRPSAEPHQITAGFTVRSCLWEVCVWYVGRLRTDYDSSPTHSLSPSSDEKYKEETFCLGVKKQKWTKYTTLLLQQTEPLWPRWPPTWLPYPPVWLPPIPSVNTDALQQGGMLANATRAFTCTFAVGQPLTLPECC